MKIHKHFTGGFKDLKDTGTASVVFATLETTDKDQDWIPKGAFGAQTVKVVGSHDWKSASIGIAQISEVGNEAVAEIKFNLDMPSAAEWYQSIKFNHENGVTQEYSFGFDVLDSSREQKNGKTVRILKSLLVHEVSPVLLGAGINTRTLDIKAEKAYAELQGTWEAAQEAIREAAQALLVGDQDGWVSLQGTYSDRVIVCVYLYGAEEYEMRYYQFAWTMREDGSVDLSSQQEVELSVIVTNKSIKFADHFARTLGEVQVLIQRQKALAALKAEQGRPLSQTHRERVSRLIKELNRFLEPGTAATPVDGEIDPNLPNQLYSQFLETTCRRTGT